MDEFSRQIEITQQSVQEALEQCRELRAYKEKEIQTFGEILKLLDKLIGEE